MHTGPGELNCKHVIHTVGPIWNRQVSAQVNVDLLHSAIYSALTMADQLKCESISIPAISSGLFGFPKPLCVKIFFQSLKQFTLDSKISEKPLNLKLVRLTNSDTEINELFQDEFMDQILGKIDFKVTK